MGGGPPIASAAQDETFIEATVEEVPHRVYELIATVPGTDNRRVGEVKTGDTGRVWRWVIPFEPAIAEAGPFEIRVTVNGAEARAPFALGLTSSN